MSDIYADLRTVRAGSIPIAAELCRLGKVRETINHLVHWKEANAKVSPGLLIESLVICILCGRKPLWKVEQFWAGQDLENVFAGVEVSVDQLNDDAYGRALDKLAEIKMEELVSIIGLTLLQAHNLSIGLCTSIPQINRSRVNMLAPPRRNSIFAMDTAKRITVPT